MPPLHSKAFGANCFGCKFSIQIFNVAVLGNFGPECNLTKFGLQKILLRENVRRLMTSPSDGKQARFLNEICCTVAVARVTKPVQPAGVIIP